VSVVRIALLLAAAAVLEFFTGGRGGGGLRIDWFLLATAIVARSGDFPRAVLTGAAAGFLEDALTQPLLGLNAFAKAILGYALTIVSVRVVLGGALAVGLALFLAELANDVIVALLLSLLIQAPPAWLTRDGLLAAAATGLAGTALEAAWRFQWGDWWKRRQLRKLR
jgi:rod shape-determining protein MreD